MSEPYAASTLLLVFFWGVSAYIVFQSFRLFSMAASFLSVYWSAGHLRRMLWILGVSIFFSPLLYVFYFSFIWANSFFLHIIEEPIHLAIFFFWKHILLLILFLLLALLTLALPVLTIIKIFRGFGVSQKVSKLRSAFAYVLTPFALSSGYILFMLLLPIALYPSRWLDPEKLMLASNGPPAVLYPLMGKWVNSYATDKHKHVLQSMPELYSILPHHKLHIAFLYLEGNDERLATTRLYAHVYRTEKRASKAEDSDN